MHSKMIRLNLKMEKKSKNSPPKRIDPTATVPSAIAKDTALMATASTEVIALKNPADIIIIIDRQIRLAPLPSPSAPTKHRTGSTKFLSTIGGRRKDREI